MTELDSKEYQKLENFIPAKVAADRVGYSSDYVSRLAREGKVTAKKIGRGWLVDIDSVKLFTLEVEAEKRKRQSELREKRRHEQLVSKRPTVSEIFEREDRNLHHKALLETAVVFGCVCLLLLVVSISRFNNISSASLVSGMNEIEVEFQQAFALGSLTEWVDTWWWFVREEKSLTTEWVNNSNDAKTTATSLPQNEFKRPPQIDVETGVLLVVEDSKGEVTSAASVAGSFSDNTLVEFVDTRNGTVTPEFRSTRGPAYPFRLVPKPRTQ